MNNSEEQLKIERPLFNLDKTEYDSIKSKLNRLAFILKERYIERWMPEDLYKWIPKEDLIEGQPYLCKGRGFIVGIWNGIDFYCLRHKFGQITLDSQLHWDDGEPFGTVKPYERFDV